MKSWNGQMKKILLIIIIVILVVSGFGANGLSLNNLPKQPDIENYDMVIIAPDIFSDALQQLVDHKNSIGVQTFLKTTEDIYHEYEGRDNAEQIKYFIKDTKEKFGIHYVLLIGSDEKIPVRYSYARNGSESSTSGPFISDLYYADIYDSNGSFCSWDSNMNNKFAETSYVAHPIMNEYIILDEVDLVPDVHIGRLLWANTNEVNIVENKIINYERNGANESWFNNLILFGGNNHPIGNELFNLFGIRILLGFSTYHLCPAWEGEYLCNKVEDLMNDFSSKKFYASSIIFRFLSNIKGTQAPTLEGMNEAFNAGAGFVLFSAHGSPDAIGTFPPLHHSLQLLVPPPSGYNISAVMSLHNSEKLPIVILGACSCGDFSTLEGIPSPLAWEFVKHDDGGSIATFAFTSEAWTDIGTKYIESKVGYLCYHLFKAYNDRKVTVGELWTKAITDYVHDDNALWEANGPLPFHYSDIQMFSLFGDPSLRIGGYNDR
jgi:hypothetical protein